jgi:cytidine deaminase
MHSIDEVEPLTDQEREQLLRAASEVAERAYAPYSNFRVGTAVLGESETYNRVNVENASYGLAICAERAALAAAIAAGEKKIRGLAIACVDASADSSAGLPCGACRQWMLELAPRAEILILGTDRPFRIEDLLPRPFQSKHLQTSR